jgi:hypothetical protein
MLTYSLRTSFKGREVVGSELLLSATSAIVVTTTDSGSTTATAATSATTATTSVVASLLELVIFLTLEREEVREFGLADSNVVDFLILKGVNNGLNSVLSGLNSLKLALLSVSGLVGSAFLLES